jgi:anti-sigma regulatory factor (Ser/Thr protein kinase)
LHGGRVPFHHEAFFYSGEREFLSGTLDFIREGVAAGEPVLVVVSAEKIARLSEGLNGDGGTVIFADMAAVGANPARIIPAWHEFVDARPRPDAPVRGIGEPIFAERSGQELVECHHHESLLNLAFADTPAFRLLCPYDTTALHSAVIDEAHRTHPSISHGTVRRESARYAGPDGAADRLAEPLPEPAVPVFEFAFRGAEFASVRATVAEHATAAGLSTDRTGDLLIAVHELATNSVRHGGGAGRLRIWHEDGTLVCEVRDRGRIDEPLVGRRRPAPLSENGYGVWIANQLCDLVQLRSTQSGTIVRLHMRTA